ncbi:hypothetical protein ACPPVT_16065 [Angustibacter sp. McL0619]|uniref:hypothetical protein n=1 Tax=Angustibacter sp. McL0619 TaxID=3415676 RepID=UPI003CFA0A75
MNSFVADLIGAAVTLLLLGLFGVLGGDDPWKLGKRRRPGSSEAGTKKSSAPIRALMMGHDGRLSTSKATAFAWTIAVVYALATLSVIAIVDDKPFGDSLDQLADSYLLLLGGPFAALVLAKGITVTRINNGTLSKPPAVDPTFSVKDLATNDAGQSDLVDFQFLMFNAVALAYVVVRFSISPHGGLPDLPTAFAGLTSISALTYTANKAVSGATPTVTSASFDPVKRILTVSGLNLGGAAATVRLDDTVVDLLDSTGSQVRFAVPADTTAGAHVVKVSALSGTTTVTAEANVDIPAAAPA